MRYESENIWLTQKMMAELYAVEISTINEHLKNIYKDSELAELATIRDFLIVQNEGSRQVNRQIKHYNLQAIIAVGFKVNNERAVRFRKWAGQVVKDYTIQGWVSDVERFLALLIAIKLLLNGSQIWERFLEDLDSLIETHAIDLEMINFPPNWKTVLK